MYDFDLPESFGRAAAAYRVFIDRLFASIDLNAGQAAVLAELWESDGPTQAELARRLGVTAPTVTKMLRTMENRGHVRLERCPLDSRAVRVFSTPAADSLRSGVAGCWEKAGERFFGVLTPTERLVFRQIVAKSFAGR